MKKLLLIAALAVCPLFGQSTIGFHRVAVALSRAQSGLNAQIVPNATVTVTQTSTGTAATIYSDPLLTSIISPSVVVADNSGNYSYYIALNYCVTETITSPGQGTRTIPNICINGSGSSGVASLNSLTGAITLTSTGGTVTITPSGSTIDLEASGGVLLQTNTTNNHSQTALNFETSTTNSVGLTVTPSNPSGGIEKEEVTGTYSGSISSSQVTTALGYTPVSPTVTSLVDLTTAAGGAFGTAAYDNTGTSGATIPLLNGSPTASGVWTFSASGALVLSAMTGTSCLEEISGIVTATGVACGSGGGGGTNVEINGGSALVTASFSNNTGAGEIDFTNPSGATVNATLHNTTISGISLGNNLDVLTFGTHLTAGGASYNGSANVTITSDATNANTASTIVARDASGNFSAGTITATLNGNATSATTATSATNFTGSLSGDVTGTQSATSVVKINGGSMPGSANVLGSNSSSQPISASAANIVAAIGSTAVTNATNATSATNIAGGVANDVLYQNGVGSTGFIAPVNSAVLITSSGGVPSESTTLPSSLTIPSPTLSGTVAGSNTIPLSILAQVAANSILGNATGSTANVAGISMPSCSTSTSALFWTSGSGIGCHAITVGSVALNSISAATGTNTISNGNEYGQVWNWALTSASQIAFTFGETTAASGTSDELLAVTTLAGSKATPLTITDSLTGSQTLSALVVTPTWNTTGVVDAGIFENVTNTASGAGSLLLDLQVGGSSEFNVDKSGNLTAAGNYTGALVNALTFNNAGSGGASGSTYTNASALTVSYNTIGAAPAVGNVTAETTSWSLVANNIYRFTGSGASNATTPATTGATGLISFVNAGTATVTVVTGGPTLSCLPASCAAPVGASVLVNTNGTDQYAIISNANGSAFGTLANANTINNSNWSGTVLAAGNGGTGVANTATLTLGSSNQNWATLGTGIVKNTTTTGAISDAAGSDIITLLQALSGCNTATYVLTPQASDCVAPSATSIIFPQTVSGTTTSGGIPYFSNTTTLTSSGILNTNILVKGGGAGGAPTNSLFTDNGTTATYSGTGGITASAGPLTAGNPSGGVGSSLFLTQEGTVPSGLSTAGEDNCYADSTQHGLLCNFNAGTTLPLVQGPASETTGHLATWSGTNGGKLVDGGAVPTGTLTSVNTLTGPAVVIEAATAGQVAISGGNAAALTGATDLTYSTHTFSATANTIFDLSAATGTAALKVPQTTTNTATAAGAIDFDTTNKNFHGYVNGADSMFLNIAAAPTNNHILIAAVATGNTLAADAGFAYTAYPAADIAAGALANGMTATTQSQLDGSTKLATTLYTDTAVSNAVAGVNPAVAVLAASTATITGTYAQVGGGVGDTFTVTATGAFTLDGIAINTIGQRVLLKNQTSANQNGIYTATTVGTTGVSAVFTRALDYDMPSDVNNTGSIPVQSGTVNTTTSWLLTSQVTSIGSSGSSLTYAQFSLAPSTIVTSAASLTNNALMTGAGGQGSQTVTTGSGVLTALGVNTGTAGAFVVNGGALGTPSGGTLTNATGLPISGVTGWGTGVATALADAVNATGGFLTYPLAGSSMSNNTVTATQLAAQYSKGACTEVWGGTNTANALQSGDDAIANNTCYNDSGVTRTITAVKCRSDTASNTTTVNPTFGSAGTGTTVLSGALTCGNSYAYSSTGTVSNASWTTGTGIDPAMGGTLTGTSIAMLVEYTF